MVSQKRWNCSVYETVAELIGKSADLDEFYRNFVKFAQADNPKFKPEKFYAWVQKFKQYAGIGTGSPELANETQNRDDRQDDAEEEMRGRAEAYESDGQPDEAQEWHDFDPEC